ncbi:serine/threonine-protein kinase 36-like isoform X1 [Phyllopteryx taeniolatus]|uniref:serine/threonine-protein kinase 36-like isoform X1 n=2 Tax=Phyllopteryx taeniolatus TaxID=161469 RepID=UPI002AD4ACBA|nr:serine/threonine-protein kinase 36-like isoform X1 [Phyllopteryx taeniolatus]
MDSYHVLAQVGQGSFGRVHKGMKRFTGQVVALKFMPKMGRSTKELQSLKKEIDIMSNLQHPNIVKLFDSFETETEVVVVTEYAEGQLFQIIEADGSLPESQVCEIACQLVSALYYLHSRRILHRDMKPQNILFDKNGVVKLCDFGFARAMSISTMVVTSIKGTPLYMSPELVAEKPYDHTADLWALGCILYEIHTGLPPFCADSIFHLGQLIVRDPIQWPKTMSSTCTSFLKGLLIKDPQKRLSWPDLLHHPFVADGVQVIPDTDVFSPLTATLDPDMLALKLKQMAEKTSPDYGESRIFRKIREQRNKSHAKKQGDSAKEKKDGLEPESDCAAAVTPLIDTSPPVDFASANSTFSSSSLERSNYSVVASSHLHRGPISQDYEQEFPSVEVGPRLERRTPKSSITVDSEEFWEKLVEESDPSRQKQEQFNYSSIMSKLKSTMFVFKQQRSDGVLKDTWHIGQPLKVLQNLILTSDLAMTNHIGVELGLPCLLIDLIHDSLENSHFIEQPWSLQTLGEMIAALLIYWEKNRDSLREENRAEEFIKPFVTILNQADLRSLAPLAASVLSLFARNKVAVNVDMDTLSSLLKERVSGSHQLQLPLPSGWGLCDGLLSLLLHTLSEHGCGFSCLDPRTFHHLWKRTGTSLAWTTPNMDFCSTNGLYFLMSATLLVFCDDPYSYISLFYESKSTFIYTLGWVLSSECLSLFAEANPVKFEVSLKHESFIQLSCHFLCLPFALDITAHKGSRILQLYDSCGVVKGLVQVIQRLPVSLVELPLSLVRRLLLCDRQRALSRLISAAHGFFSAPTLAPLDQQTSTRTASSLLSDLLQLDELGDSAVELLSLLYLVTSFCPNSGCLQLYLESSVLHQGLAHSYDPIKAATCKVLGKLHPFKSPTLPNLHPNILKSMIDLLEDSNVHVRQAACLSVGKWLGYIAVEAGFSTKSPNGNGGNTTERLKAEDNDAHGGSRRETHIAMVTGENELPREMRQWLEEARMAAATLASLTSDPDAHTRLHACAALGNLLHVEGAVPELLDESVSRLVLRAACTDSHKAVREAAIATLNLYTRQDSMLQDLQSLNAEKKLQASEYVPSECESSPHQTTERQLRELL